MTSKSIEKTLNGLVISKCLMGEVGIIVVWILSPNQASDLYFSHQHSYRFDFDLWPTSALSLTLSLVQRLLSVYACVVFIFINFIFIQFVATILFDLPYDWKEQKKCWVGKQMISTRMDRLIAKPSFSSICVYMPANCSYN